MAGIELYAPRTQRHRRTWTAAAIILTLVFIVLGQVPAAIALMAAGIPLQPGVSWTGDTLLLLSFACIAILFFLWVWLFERRSLATIGFNSDFVRRYVRGLLLGLAFSGAVIGGIFALGGYTIENAGFWAAPSLSLFIPIIAIFIGFVVQGAAEEIAMRGYLMQIIASRHGIFWGIGVTTILFSLLHATNLKPSNELYMGLVNIVLVGIFFGLYAIKERSLWGVCAWHTAWNWFLGVGFGVEVSGQRLDAKPIVVDLAQSDVPWWITGGAFGPEGSVVTTVVLLAGIAWQVSQGALKPGAGYPTPTYLESDETAQKA
ncbi:CPBP family intramembrane glutamic endopeptidase [Asticcacaulis biprosthecium]|uniref:CPBP family intramembrane glutamic endopeptidase n=1 Tax=Asticcacaulis biprosthecium TaxID=76891 RepID=UPI000316428E|nr:type II CAAX endopeptidase family protein [Asticcacaulis biprosthecium]